MDQTGFKVAEGSLTTTKAKTAASLSASYYHSNKPLPSKPMSSKQQQKAVTLRNPIPCGACSQRLEPRQNSGPSCLNSSSKRRPWSTLWPQGRAFQASEAAVMPGGWFSCPFGLPRQQAASVVTARNIRGPDFCGRIIIYFIYFCHVDL